MQLIDLVVRWLRSRSATVTEMGAGTRVELAAQDPLRATLGDSFTLAEWPGDELPPPGVEPVFPGSRIADLCAGELEGISGIAVLGGSRLAAFNATRFIFSFRAVLLTTRRRECLIRFALTEDGHEATIPEDLESLRPGDSGQRWRPLVARLLETACEIAQQRAIEQAQPIEREAQSNLYLAARRLASYYSKYRSKQDSVGAITAEYQRRLAEEVDRHQVRITISLIGVTVAGR